MKKLSLGRLHNEQGFTLIQAMIGLGLMTSMALGYAAISAQMSKSNATQQVNFERDSLGNYIKSLVSNELACTPAIDKNLVKIDDAIMSVVNSNPDGLEVAFDWGDLKVAKEERLDKYKVIVQKIYIKSVRKMGVSEYIPTENYYQGELIIKEKSISQVTGSSEFKERSLGPVTLAAIGGVVTKCGGLSLVVPRKLAAVGGKPSTAEILKEAGVILPEGQQYPLGEVTSTCDLKCVVDNFYARNNLSNESKAEFYKLPQWTEIASNYSSIATELARMSGANTATAAANGIAGLDYEILNNPLVTERTLDGLAHAMNDVGGEAVHDFLSSQGAEATALASSIISANDGYSSGTYSSADLADVYNAAAAAGITAAQADAFFANGGTIEQAIAMAHGL